MCANPVCIPPKTPKGTIAPLDDGSGHGNVHTRIRLPAWMPEWLDLNFMVPLIATVVVVAVGICVVCVALSGGERTTCAAARRMCTVGSPPRTPSHKRNLFS